MANMEFKGLNGALVTLNAKPDGKDIVFWLNACARTNKWMQFTSDIMTINDVTGRPVQEVRLLQFNAFIITKTNGVRAVHGALDKLETPPYAFETCCFWAELKAVNFRPKKFVVTLPKLIVDGSTVEFPPITFESKVAIDFWTDGP